MSSPIGAAAGVLKLALGLVLGAGRFVVRVVWWLLGILGLLVLLALGYVLATGPPGP